jgi:hypothetical protein
MQSTNWNISTTGVENYSAGLLPIDSTNQWNRSRYNQLNVFPQTKNVRWFDFPRNNPKQGTSGSQISENFLDVISFSNVIEAAREFLKSVQNKDHVNKAEEILAIIQSEIIKRQPQIILPPISAFLAENGALLLEWYFIDFRIGFNLEVAENESGWYLASKPSAGGIISSGLFTGIDIHGIIAWLVNFATSGFLP